MQTICFALILISLMKSVTSQIQEEYFKIMHGHQVNKLTTSFVRKASPNIIHCSMLCLDNQFCKAANYYDSSAVCEFTTANIGSTGLSLVPNNGSTFLFKPGVTVYDYPKTWKDYGAPDCFYGKYTDYNGTVNYTVSGKTCHNWNSNSTYKPLSQPTNAADANTNYCRADGVWPEIWCYTTDPSTRWETCGIVPCYGCGVMASLPPNLPNTKINITFRGKVHAIFECALLTPGTSHVHCPVSTCEENDQWSSGYNISCTTEDCYTNSNTYRGKMSCTVSGRTCQYWNTNTPHHKYYTPSDPMDHDTNYCRDPSNDGVPWCYTTDSGVRWEPCPILIC